MHSDPGLVVALAYDGLCLFEFGIAAEVFGLKRPEFTFPWYRFAVAAVEPGPMHTLGGLSVQADGGLDLLESARTIVIPGWRSLIEPPPAPLLAALRRAEARGARILTLCSGVFPLAASSLLNGKRATTHSRHLAVLRQRYPAIEAVTNVLYVDEGQLITAAGSAAGIDAALHLVRRDFGAAVANAVARRMVVAGHREGDRPQDLPLPGPQARRDRFEDALDYARTHLDRTHTVAHLAAVAAMSERTFLRRFRERLGTNPKAWLLAERIGRAQELLETESASLQDVATSVGFQSVETFRAAFRREVGVAPAAYRGMRRLSSRQAARGGSIDRPVV